MKRTIMATAAALALLASSAHGATVLDGSFDEAAFGAAFEDVHRAVAADFSDPRSAQYKGLVFKELTIFGSTVCGWVNARGPNGGYGPFEPFAYHLQDGSVFIANSHDDREDMRSELYVHGCAEALGVAVPTR